MQLPLSGFEGPLSEMEQTVQDATHHFALNVMRPAGALLDRMTPEEIIAPGSILWDVMKKSEALGLKVTALAELPPLERVRLSAIASEELAWGDLGLAGAILINHFPVMYAMLAGNMEMANFCEGKLGCWAVTEPEHGSDVVDDRGLLDAARRCGDRAAGPAGRQPWQVAGQDRLPCDEPGRAVL
jgi:acyl-CoA dehydrogenase